MWIYPRPESANGPKKKRKQGHKMWYVVRKLCATGGMGVPKEKLVTHFEKIMC